MPRSPHLFPALIMSFLLVLLIYGAYSVAISPEESARRWADQHGIEWTSITCFKNTCDLHAGDKFYKLVCQELGGDCALR